MNAMRSNLVILTLIAFTIVAGIASMSFAGTASQPTVAELHFSITPTTLEEVLVVSDLVVTGEVLAIQGVKVPSPIRTGKNDIMTDVILKINDTWFNEVGEKNTEITFRAIGGKMSNKELIVGEVQPYEPGQKILVFLKKVDTKQAETNSAMYEPTARVHARFTIENGKIGNMSQLENTAKEHLFGAEEDISRMKMLVEDVARGL